MRRRRKLPANPRRTAERRSLSVSSASGGNLRLSRPPADRSLLYRTLLDSILRRARTPTYGHGACYLRKLDLLTKTVSDWSDIELHAVYVEQLQKKHGRKTSFWGRYER